MEFIFVEEIKDVFDHALIKPQAESKA
jgi:hypothetical protein